MASQFCERYLPNSVVLCLLSLLCNHDSLKLKLHQKIATLMKGDFLQVDSKLEVY